MPTTSANQLEITINKPRYAGNFLSIAKNEWIIASTLLTYSEFKVFQYLAGNAPGYKLAYSPQAVSNELDISRGTASEARRSLELLGYLEANGGNHLDFYTQPKRIEEDQGSSPEVKAAKRRQDLAAAKLIQKGIKKIFR